ncbi:MAG: DNA polymerase III subunit beta [Candidatus Blackburnbacteria bacterium]|nr:DNA polymerase III subunit beta [Candidatus Blackburnbacteria bacterium]
MKISVLQEDFLQKITLASRFVSSRAQIPILGNILLKAQEGKLQISATNLEIGISASIGAKVQEPGDITIPAKILSEIIGNLRPGKIELEEKKGHLEISTADFSASIAGIPAAEFPNVPSELPITTFSLTKETLSTLAKQIAFAAADTDTRPVLTGILLQFEEDRLIAVATDGFRMSYTELKTNSDLFNKEIETNKNKEEKQINNSGKQVLLPAKVIEELEKIANYDTEKIRVAVLEKEGKLLFGSESVVLTSRVLEGQFPDYNRVIPKDWTVKVIAGKDELARAVKGAAVFARESASIIKLNIKQNQITITSESNLHGKEEVTVEAKTEGESTQIAYNYRYLLDFFNSVSKETISLETQGSTAPGVFQDTSDSTYKHIIMPVRIQNN